MKEKLFEQAMPTKITFDDDSFDLTTIEFDKVGKFSTDSAKAAKERKFKASMVDVDGALREFDCEVESISGGRVVGRWTEIDQ